MQREFGSANSFIKPKGILLVVTVCLSKAEAVAAHQLTFGNV
jgi:hypothetical protein